MTLVTDEQPWSNLSTSAYVNNTGVSLNTKNKRITANPQIFPAL
jgi:hypothetical protein